MKPDDQANNGSVATMVGVAVTPPTAAEPLKGGNSSKKATKKAKAKAAKTNGSTKDRLAPASPGRVDGPGPMLSTIVAIPAEAAGRTTGEREDQRVGQGDEDPGLMSIGDRSAPGTEEPVTTATEAPDREAGLSEEAGEPDQPATAPSAKRRWMRSNTALAGGCLLVAALTVALVLSLLALTNQDAQAGARTSALTAARTYAVQLASYDYRNLDRNFAIVAGESTPSFRRSFTESSDALKATLAKYKATAGATVVSAGLVSSGTSQAEALVFLTQKIANATQSKPTTDRSQVQISLVKSGGRWLINQVTLL